MEAEQSEGRGGGGLKTRAKRTTNSKRGARSTHHVVKGHRVHRVEEGKVVLVGGIVAVPAHHVEGRVVVLRGEVQEE